MSLSPSKRRPRQQRSRRSGNSVVAVTAILLLAITQPQHSRWIVVATSRLTLAQAPSSTTPIRAPFLSLSLFSGPKHDASRRHVSIHPRGKTLLRWLRANTDPNNNDEELNEAAAIIAQETILSATERYLGTLKTSTGTTTTRRQQPLGSIVRGGEIAVDIISSSSTSSNNDSDSEEEEDEEETKLETISLLSLKDNVEKDNVDEQITTPQRHSLCQHKHRVTVCAEKGARPYMEDTYVWGHLSLLSGPNTSSSSSTGGGVAAVFDGHGGKAVSRYLQQNLLAELGQAQQHIVKQEHTKYADAGGNHEEATTTQPQVLSVDHCLRALRLALEKLDNNVQEIRHWSYQGSTAVVVWIHQQPKYEQDTPLGSNDSTKLSTMPTAENEPNPPTKAPPTFVVEDDEDEDLSMDMPPLPPHNNHTTATTTTTTLLVANIGDSRAILCRDGHAVPITHDHKPDDPAERKRIESHGGRVVMPNNDNPLAAGGVPRVNGNLALSRAVGDRSERPFVTAEPDLYTVPVFETNNNENNNNNSPDFVLLATDGLWDVMSNQEVADFVLMHLANMEKQQEGDDNDDDNNNHQVNGDQNVKDTITQLLVQEAFARGSYDNVTVLIVWLNSK